MDAKVNLFCITFFLGHNFKRNVLYFSHYVNVGVLSILCKFTYRNRSFLKEKKKNIRQYLKSHAGLFVTTVSEPT